MFQINALKIIMLLIVVCLAPPLRAADKAPATVLITGSNRGIGLEFAKEYAAAGWTVIATQRTEKVTGELEKLLQKYPKTMAVEQLDVTDPVMIDALAARYKGKPIDVLINNAGIVGALDHVKDQMFGSLDYDLFKVFMATNVAGPLKISEAFHENVKSSRQKRIVMITSLAGSFQDAATNRPGRIFYKTSKAALNMAMTCIATATAAEGITVVAIHPGGVKVEKLAGYDLPGFIEPSESIGSMIKVIDKLQIADSGKVLNYTGEVLPW